MVTKNKNWEILTMNLVTFKRWDVVKDEKFQYYGGSLKNSIFKGLGHFSDLREGGSLAKKRGGGGVDTPMHTT